MNKEELAETTKIEIDTEQCMKCGFCAYVCPVYQEDKTEASLARGKNELVKRLMSGELELNRDLADRLYKCTACMACTANCPSKAPIPRIVVAARADIARTLGVRFPYGFAYRNLLANRRLLGPFLSAASFFQKTFMPATDGSLRHLPSFLSGLGQGRNIPVIASKFLRRQAPEISKTRNGAAPVMRVGYFSGCMNEFVTPHIGKKTIDILTRHGVEVVMPRTQGCCGAAVFLGAGDFATGRKIADSNVAAFEGLDYVVTDCATCSCSLNEYAHFLADTPERKEAYTKFSGKIRHISQFLTDTLDLQASAFQPSAEIIGKKITWHDPCHLNRHLGIKEQPRRILASLADAAYIEMPDADRCCGMGGQFNLLNYDLSMQIARRKTESIEASGADIVVTACPGCQLQLMDSAARLNKTQKVMNLMEVIG
ncbi:MAG TPA: (Fe-S)-binding protein [Acidobacteriota bacterium]|nr:(Fe-S)-binding protein [Acidobacteriota bacterium]